MTAPLSPHVRLTVDGSVARIRLDRPARRNALDQAMWESIPPLVYQASATPAIRLILFGSATPGHFCAGADIAEFAERSADAVWRARNQAAIRAAQLALTRAPVPVVALVDGDCVGGGCGLALAADLRIASPRARFGITPARLGLVYPLHDTRLLVDLVGPGQARRLLYTGRLIPSEEARRIGLVEDLADDVEQAAQALVAEMLGASAYTQRATRAVVRRILEGQTDDDAASTALFADAFTGPDFAEGVSAFLGKRQPRFGA
jgi:enoyl-CoA hydratase/carnithine racemase